MNKIETVHNEELSFAEDVFMQSEEFKNYSQFQSHRKKLKRGQFGAFTDQKIQEFKKLNPKFWETHELAGDYYRSMKKPDLARMDYEHALTLEIPTLPERRQVERKLTKLRG